MIQTFAFKYCYSKSAGKNAKHEAADSVTFESLDISVPFHQPYISAWPYGQFCPSNLKEAGSGFPTDFRHDPISGRDFRFWDQKWSGNKPSYRDPGFGGNFGGVFSTSRGFQGFKRFKGGSVKRPDDRLFNGMVKRFFPPFLKAFCWLFVIQHIR